MNRRDHRLGSIRSGRISLALRPASVEFHLRGSRVRVTITRKSSHALASVQPSSGDALLCPSVASKPKGQHLKLPARNNQVQR